MILADCSAVGGSWCEDPIEVGSLFLSLMKEIIKVVEEDERGGGRGMVEGDQD